MLHHLLSNESPATVHMWWWQVRVDTLHIRPAPFLSSDTPMWALLKIFKSGRSHMVMLTKPHQHPRNGLPPGEPELQVHTLNYFD